jgi:adenine-specific DNA methylase
LEVINKKSLYNLKDCSLDGVFCSYVLHFVSDTEQFKMLLKKLKPGCILAANFHKNIGVSKFISLVESFKGEIEQLSFDISGSSFAFKKPLIPFVEIELIENYVDNNLQVSVDTELIEALLNINVIPKYFFNSKSYVIETDLRLLVPFLKSITSCCWKDSETNLYQKYFSINLIDTEICLINIKTNTLDSSNVSLLHKILSSYNISDKLDKTFSFFIGSSIKVFTTNSKIKELVNEHQGLTNVIDQSKASIFTNSASYMGSKKSLRSFIVESSTIYLNSESSILDIMCGSGSVAGATSMKWQTYASDAMKFCRILGKVQGSGFSLKRANELLTDLHIDVQKNIKYLKNIFKEELELEDILLHSEICEDLKLRYNKFCYSYSYPNGKFGEMYFAQTNTQNQWSLFSLAYSNLYLGLRQAIELDSYRYAIEQILNEEDKSWALAALITTISAVGNNYGGHFAQPKYKDIEALNLNGLFSLMEQRSISISNEFAIRLRSIAFESEKSKGAKIESLDGPWENALMSFSAKLIEKTINLVYLDAPYTRDEYSRYYHLLETLVDYKYYPLIGVGRVPDKKNSSRFSSEFFTKTSNKLKLQYVKIISKILDEGLICAWSYSDSATVAAMEIILEVSSITDCIVTSLSTPYSYKAQGGQASKNINEYLIFFQPKL